MEIRFIAGVARPGITHENQLYWQIIILHSSAVHDIIKSTSYTPVRGCRLILRDLLIFLQFHKKNIVLSQLLNFRKVGIGFIHVFNAYYQKARKWYLCKPYSLYRCVLQLDVCVPWPFYLYIFRANISQEVLKLILVIIFSEKANRTFYAIAL